MLEELINFLISQNWKYSDQRTIGIITFSLTGKNGIYHCVADVREDTKMFIFISFAGNHCPENKRFEIIQLFNKLNTNLPFGNFELDENSGQMKFRTSQFLYNLELTKEILESIIYRNLNVMDFSSPHLLQLIYGESNLQEVFTHLFPAQSKIEEGVAES